MNSVINSTDTISLTDAEQRDYQLLDETVIRCRQAFLEGAAALHEILERRLYLAEFPTFEAYCTSRGISRQHAYRLAAASETVAAIQECNPVGDSEPATIPMPTSERQVRPLAQLPVEERAAAWKEAAADSAPTAKEVEAVVEQRLRVDDGAEDDVKQQEAQPAQAAQRTSKEKKGRLWSEVAFADCSRHPGGAHQWGDEHCDCLEDKPQNREQWLLHDVTRTDLPLKTRTEAVLKAMEEPDSQDRLGHSLHVELHRRWVSCFDEAVGAIRLNAVPHPECKPADGDPLDKALAEAKLLAVCAILDGDVEKRARRSA